VVPRDVRLGRAGFLGSGGSATFWQPWKLIGEWSVGGHGDQCPSSSRPQQMLHDTNTFSH
jgi:hypothetical protein